MLATLALVLSTAFFATASPLEAVQARDEPATVNFTPYEYVGCRQSQDPYDPATPSTYNVTSGSCITPPYTFQSYVEEANSLAANGPCSLSLFPEPNCQGQGVGATLTTYYTCQTGDNDGGASFILECGP
ncbi:hypothetical protein CONPUDRAFT_140112 [Coniophora puteana RWD-64-598 SS2]|uniref:Uncharacterized protein n=1 Tax=Coniophora puteana (strain RWD-64-598) TaxID=741705 RepID=A0A5M3M8Z6_CONPW|nr:uncharacterized protein CONPUDRAFT_140112 [Coniophora puteana RWD-64-598 SS2]EIW75111.1 hypothetical protein CONPUDRAFT_140112 [Coniophora puteana RWD-64-598 SS2]